MNNEQKQPEQNDYEVTVWEKAEHWNFYVTIRAESEEAARAEAIKQFPRRSYVIRHVHCIR